MEFGLDQEGVGIAPTTENVSEEALKAVEEFKTKILNGEISSSKTDEEFAAFK
ncbi:hypothetical protein KHA80_05675 [Anaerobacillus sp. HL2]|nr:hypothetical protein KHA80_05675 [Anaerobacillus sp. HL2]